MPGKFHGLFAVPGAGAFGLTNQKERRNDVKCPYCKEERRQIIYLDNAATTFPKPEIVHQAADAFYRRFGGNAGRGANPPARKGAELVAETRALLAEWMGAPSPERVV
ncbi:MAG TPA: aminotransferase class V-fold PLP-dependent enzyme, partial [Planctomycetaceae bacterium]|nr:aminotransferase class V-fold PLP-dependent enzyme [Planctomycetaceae bacterium]